MKYYNLPTKRRQLVILCISIGGYAVLLLAGAFLMPSLDETVKKRLTQLGIVVLYMASLCAGIGFIWSSKGRHNKETALAEIIDNDENIKLHKDQERLLSTSFKTQIERAEHDIVEARRRLTAVEELPKFYELCGNWSLILVAAGTLLCLVGVG